MDDSGGTLEDQNTGKNVNSKNQVPENSAGNKDSIGILIETMAAML